MKSNELLRLETSDNALQRRSRVDEASGMAEHQLAGMQIDIARSNLFWFYMG